jgi:hypothetical protein
MTVDAMEMLFKALALPLSAQVNQRVAKALLGERGGLSSTDRRLVDQGVERLTWRATLKPASVGVEAFQDNGHDYSQIVVMVGHLRVDAKAARLIELVHRAVAHPLVMIAGEAAGASLSVGLKRRHEREASRMVIERLAISPPVTGARDQIERAFLASLALAAASASNLWSLHKGWGERCEAFEAARIAGGFRVPGDEAEAETRRTRLAAYAAKAREVVRLRKAAATEQRLNRRVDLSRDVARGEAELARLAVLLA